MIVLEWPTGSYNHLHLHWDGVGLGGAGKCIENL